MELFATRMTPARFFKLTAPAVVSMVFIALYTVVDGIFVARYVGETALAAVNITLPVYNVTFGLGIMLATGGSALVGIAMGEGRHDDARRTLSLLSLVGFVAGLALSALLIINLDPIVRFLGATPALYELCRTYGFVLGLTMPFAIVKAIFEYFIRTDGNPRLSLALSVSGGLINILFDYIFIVRMNMGIAGAAWGTLLGCLVPALLGGLYFLLKRQGLCFARPRWDGRALLRSCTNGSSEMVTELSTGVTTLLFNLVTLRYLGEEGISAITIILYSHFLLNSVYLGLVCGVAPAISYNYGANDRAQLARIISYSRRFLLISAVGVFALSLLGAPVLVGIFTSPGSAVFPIALRGQMLFSGCFLFIGINVFASGMFTAFGNGLVSAAISFLRAFVFPVAGVLLLPSLLGGDGIWLALPLAELLTLGFSLTFLLRYQTRYHYTLLRRPLTAE